MPYRELSEALLDCPDKSIPLRLPSGGANVLAEDLHFPLLVLKESALAHNIAAMAKWCSQSGLLLAPHGKTTMCPRIWHRQLDAGAWGITVATVSQALACVAAGVPRILIANQVVGRSAAASLAQAMHERAGVEVYCLVDSVDSVRQLASQLTAAGAVRTVSVLVEWGRPGWRTGVRSVEEALPVLEELKVHGHVLRYAGVEGFEGLAHSESGPAEEVHEVDDFLRDAARFAFQFGVPSKNELPIFSIGGTAFLDRVREIARAAAGRYRVVARSGCYVTHDHGYYSSRLQAAEERSPGAVPEFKPALELWSLVQSRPDPGIAILTFGKRDCAYDIDLPLPLFTVPASGPRSTQIRLHPARISHLNDQHAYLCQAPDGLRVGDLVCCGISHPCTAFDKWRVIPTVDDSYSVLDWYRTYF